MSRGPRAVRRRVVLVAALALSFLGGAVATAAPPGGSQIAAATPRPDPSGILAGRQIRGMFLDDRGAHPELVAQDLQRLKAIGVNTIPLYIWLSTPSIHSNTITKSPNITPDDKLRWLINRAHELGMAVNLVPYVKVEPPESLWRGKINPPDPAQWFANYRALLRPYERLAEETKVELFTVGSELYALQQPAFLSYWQAVTTEARLLFKGRLTYQSSSGDNATQNMTWWNLVDFIGISPYFSLSPNANPPVADLVRTWKNSYLPSLKTTSEHFQRKVLFAEIGYTNNSLTAWKPAKIWDLSQGELSPKAQANAYEALIEATKDLTWYAGTQWFHWDPHNDGTKVDYNPRDKPAECVIAIWWAANRDGTLTQNCPGSMFPGPGASRAT